MSDLFKKNNEKFLVTFELYILFTTFTYSSMLFRGETHPAGFLETLLCDFTIALKTF